MPEALVSGAFAQADVLRVILAGDVPLPDDGGAIALSPVQSRRIAFCAAAMRIVPTRRADGVIRYAADPMPGGTLAATVALIEDIMAHFGTVEPELLARRLGSMRVQGGKPGAGRQPGGRRRRVRAAVRCMSPGGTSR
ncbi:MAG: hypothetical protein HC844_20750, partial [Tabrizicola sp.]|nr:hypothetical protein [Tabrizicola sp.]